MISRKKNIIDKKIQFNTAITASAISLLSSLLITLLFFFSATKNNQEIEVIVKELKKSVKTEDSIIKAFIQFASTIKNDKYELITDKVMADHNKSIASINGTLETLESHVKRNFSIFIVIALIGLLQAIAIYYILIRITHRIAGPVYVMKKILKDVNAGRKPDIKSLRKNDGLGEFYDELIKTVNKLERKRKKEEKKKTGETVQS